MKGITKFVPEKPRNIRKKDYLILKDGRECRVSKVENGPTFQVFIPGSTITEAEKKVITFDEIESKLVLWAYTDEDEPIARISEKADFIKANEVIDGWIENIYYDQNTYKKVFKVKCPHCKHSF
jgi:hypothetical protein